MWNDVRVPVFADLDRLELLLGEQDRLMKLASQSLRDGSEADPRTQMARLRLEIFHAIAAELREKITMLREDFMMVKFDEGMTKVYIN
jgi:hypothetical protein